MAGHADTLLSLGKAKLCKPVRDSEHAVYVAVFGAVDGDDGIEAESTHVVAARATAGEEASVVYPNMIYPAIRHSRITVAKWLL